MRYLIDTQNIREVQVYFEKEDTNVGYKYMESFSVDIVVKKRYSRKKHTRTVHYPAGYYRTYADFKNGRYNVGFGEEEEFLAYLNYFDGCYNDFYKIKDKKIYHQPHIIIFYHDNTTRRFIFKINQDLINTCEHLLEKNVFLLRIN